MAEPTKAAGYKSRIKINNAFFGVRNFRPSRSVDMQECGDTEDGRFKRNKATRKEARISFTIIADPNQIPSLVYDVYEGSYVAIEYYPFGIVQGDLYDFPDVAISEVGEQQDVNGLIEMSVSGVTNGEYTLPGDGDPRE